jgi:hypothetical protein
VVGPGESTRSGPLALQLTIPPERGPAADVLVELRDRVQALEADRAPERPRASRRGCGRRAVLAQSGRSQPTTPRVAAQRKWARIEALLRNLTFVAAYATARAAWREGIPALFPPGTYWLGRFGQVSVAVAEA